MELQSNLEKIRAQGLGVAAISYDSVAVLKNFAERRGIAFTLLSDPDSKIEVLLEKTPGGTKLTIHHTNIPSGQSDYKSGWRECYFEPMKNYFKANAKPA